MKTEDVFKRAIRRIRKELGLRVVLLKTAHQKENCKIAHDVSFFNPTARKCWVTYPKNKEVAENIRDIVEDEIKTEKIAYPKDKSFGLTWSNNLKESMLIE
ncbi:hypothetical protein [Poseidonibacter ostreae]|uniref:Uncharacterized protein n=1 Tax=Poseidonibacter ostreae TaxID=2654171 RepID=A0A6L4WWG3_9BACT|nr:hypothetical protein [Poseidonibacter ostreae]KAB7891392.1 hypothetical protein GBG19_00720 [Poseidonibacter ostreae]